MNNICYIATTFNGINTGKGGHYYSLVNIAQEILNNGQNVFVLNIGNKNATALEQSKLRYHWIFFNGYNLFSSLIKISSFLKRNNINIIHCFDKNSLLFGLYFSKKFKIRIISTKCGGPLTRWYPKINQLIVFSEGDLIDFKKRYHYNQNNIHLIPSRVLPFEGKSDRVEKLKKDYNINSDVPIFLRICRIASQNYKSIIQTINLVDLLNKAETKCQFLIIGLVEDNSVFETIKREKEKVKSGMIITATEYTNNSKELIPIANFVVGSGRSIMEAANFSLPLLVPNNNLNIPVPLNKNTYKKAFSNNFSYRTNFDLIEEDVLAEIKELIKFPDNYKNYQYFSKEMFDKYFNIKTGITDILNVYSAASSQNSFVDIIKLGTIVYYNILNGFFSDLKRKVQR